VAHVGEELALGQIGLLGRLFCQAQLLGLAALRDVTVDAEDGRLALVLDERGVDLEEHPAAVPAELGRLEVVEDPSLHGLGDLPLTLLDILRDFLERHADELFAAEAIDLAGPAVDVEDDLALGRKDEDGVVSVLENPAVVQARLAQLFGAFLDAPLELVAVFAELFLGLFQLGGPQCQQMRPGEALPTLPAELRAQQHHVAEEEGQAEELPAAEVPVDRTQDADDGQESRQDQGGDEDQHHAGHVGVEDDAHASDHGKDREDEERLAAGAEAREDGEEQPAEDLSLQDEHGIEADAPPPGAGGVDLVEAPDQVDAHRGESRDGDQRDGEADGGLPLQVRRQP
jgi:hypothetical protein